MKTELSPENKFTKYTKVIAILVLSWIVFALLSKNLIEREIANQEQFQRLVTINMISGTCVFLARIAIFVFSVKLIRLYKSVEKKHSFKTWYYIAWFLSIITALAVVFTVAVILAGIV